MKRLLILFLLIYLYLEVNLFVTIANQLGVLFTLIAFFTTSCIGMSLLKRQRLTSILSMQQTHYFDGNDLQPSKKSMATLLASLLLVIPGFLTDILGAFLLIPSVQNLFSNYVIAKIKRHPYFNSVFTSRNAYTNQNDDIIEGSFSHKYDDKIGK
jgi:UPF0716 protein FxsA